MSQPLSADNDAIWALSMSMYHSGKRFSNSSNAIRTSSQSRTEAVMRADAEAQVLDGLTVDVETVTFDKSAMVSVG